MKLHRFYIEEMHNRFGEVSMGEIVWMHDVKLLNQWLRVLRYRVGDELILFNNREERLYKISIIEPDSVKLEMVTELERRLPEKEVYLFWALLKKDKNDWVLQKATELGVHKLVPIITDRTEKTGFDVERARKIIIEASEQCGRADIPEIREPISITEIIKEYSNLQLYICEQHDSELIEKNNNNKIGLVIGPEGGWSDNEKSIFKQSNFKHINLGKFTLRAETAAVVALAKIV